MPDHPTIGETLDFIREAHSGQTDRMGVPYWLHCVRVMCLLPADADDEMRHAALLHDVLEDTEVTRTELRLRGYSHRVVAAVSMLTRVKNGSSYDNHIRYVAAEVATSTIKRADLLDNLSPSRAAGLTPELEARYRKALEMLEGTWGPQVQILPLRPFLSLGFARPAPINPARFPGRNARPRSIVSHRAGGR